jgi:hypothetical protein
MGQATGHTITRHTHPAVTPEASPPVQATGIDYLRLLEAAHHDQVGQAINFTALAGDQPADQPGDQPAEQDAEQDAEQPAEQDAEQDDEHGRARS